MPDYTLVLKTFANYRKMAPDDEALLELLRGMNESQREMLREILGPPVKAKATKPATKKLKQCDICGISKRAAHHRDVNHPDYHEFDAGGQAGTEKKSKRALELAEKLPKPLGQGVKADEYEDGAAKRTKPTLCAYEIDGKVCHGEEDDGIHDKSLGYGNYHPFVSSSSARNAADQSSTNDSAVSSGTGLEDVSVAAGG